MLSSRLIIGAVDAYNTGDTDTCISSMKAAKTYIDSGGQHMGTATTLMNTYNEKRGVK